MSVHKPWNAGKVGVISETAKLGKTGTLSNMERK